MFLVQTSTRATYLGLLPKVLRVASPKTNTIFLLKPTIYPYVCATLRSLGRMQTRGRQAQSSLVIGPRGAHGFILTAGKAHAR